MKPTKHMAVQTFHLMSKIMKILKLKNKEADKLIALMNRGLVYTDAHYVDYKSQEKIFNLVKNQLVIKIKYYVPYNKTITIKNSI